MATTTATTATTTGVAEMGQYGDSDLLVRLDQRMASRAIPNVCNGYATFVALSDRDEIESLVAEINAEAEAACGAPLDDDHRLAVQFTPAPLPSVEEFDASATTTSDLIAVVGRACDGRFIWDEEERTWCLAADPRCEQWGRPYWETEDEAADSRREAAVDALRYLVDDTDLRRAAVTHDVYLVLAETAHGRRYWTIAVDPDASVGAEERRLVRGPALLGPDGYPTERDAAEALADEFDLDDPTTWPFDEAQEQAER